LGIEKKCIEGYLRLGFEKGVVEKGIWIRNGVEDFESVVEMVVFRAEVDDTRHGMVICRETEAEKEGVVLFQLRHG